MTVQKRVSASVSTHIPNQDKVKVEDAEFDVLNHQEPADILHDPEDLGDVSTHSDKEPKVGKVTKAKVATKAAITDKQLPDAGNTHVDNDVDPAAAYLEEESGMRVIDPGAGVTADAEPDEEEMVGDEDDEDLEASVDDEFGDLDTEDGPMVADAEDGDGMEEFEAPVEEVEPEAEPAPEMADFEAAPESTEDVSLLDVDQVPEADETDVQFATIANVIHAIRGNRIIASMGPMTAARNKLSDIYLKPQYLDVVEASIQQKGLRKGLVSAGFKLSKVRVSASKTVAKVIEAKVSASMSKKVEAMAKKEAALDQCLAIAAVGINRHFFKDTNNELKAALETELVHAGVQNGARIVRAMFAKHGVSYARSLLTLANKLSAMPEVVRNQYAEALDMTSDGDYEPEEDLDEVQSAADEDMEEFEPLPASVSAALRNPLRNNVGLLLAGGSKLTAASEILTGKKTLV